MNESAWCIYVSCAELRCLPKEGSKKRVSVKPPAAHKQCWGIALDHARPIDRRKERRYRENRRERTHFCWSVGNHGSFFTCCVVLCFVSSCPCRLWGRTFGYVPIRSSKYLPCLLTRAVVYAFALFLFLIGIFCRSFLVSSSSIYRHSVRQLSTLKQYSCFCFSLNCTFTLTTPSLLSSLPPSPLTNHSWASCSLPLLLHGHRLSLLVLHPFHPSSSRCCYCY